MVHGDVPEERGQLGRIPEQVPQDGHGQLHRGGRVLGLKATTPLLPSWPSPSPRGGGTEVGQQGAAEKHHGYCHRRPQIH